MVRLRLDIGYDGTEFHGWAAQPGLRTVQAEMEAAVALLLRVPVTEVKLTVGGRTDAGVHARGQVAHVDVGVAQFHKWGGRSHQPGGDADSQAHARRLNGVLRRYASDIVVHRVAIVPHAFDARFSALRRRYEYRLQGSDTTRDPLSARFTAEVPRPLDLSIMQVASDQLLGLNDFTTFCKARERSTAVRTLLRFEWSRAVDGVCVARIEADAFCHSMVRALVGGVVAVGSGQITLDELEELRVARERTSRFVVMPARGLSLEEIVYPPDVDLADRARLTRARRDDAAD